MVKLTRDDVLHLAKLARLELSDDEIKTYQAELSEVLAYVEKLNEADIESIEPSYQVSGLQNVTRKDEEINYGASKEELLKNAPEISSDGSIKVRRVIA